MRYLIDVKTKKGEEKLTALMNDLGASQADYIDSYEPKERLTKEVEKVGRALREYQKSGISKDILRYYLRGKGHSNNTIEALVGDVESFFKKMGILE